MKARVLLLLILTSLLAHSYAEQCGQQAGGVLCPNGLCCSQWGWCGTTITNCGDGCQSQCWGPPLPPSPPTPSPPLPPPRPDGVIQVINSSIFDEFLPYRNDPLCPAAGFYTFEAFVAAADTFPDFATTDDMETRKREIAAFFGQTSHETTGGWPGAPGGQFAWGYCFKEEVDPQIDYCVPSDKFPCVAGKRYFGRGPIQLSFNNKYGSAGEALGLDLLSNPDLVAQDAVVAFRTAIWFWMTPQPAKPSSCHDVIVGRWKPTRAEILLKRLPGYGLITNIINGQLECGHGPDDRVLGRIQFYKRYCDIYEISYGDNLDCDSQVPFIWGLTAKRGPNESKATF